MICRICKQTKSENDFWKQPRNSTGYETACKQCTSLRHYERRRERRLEQGLSVKFPTLAGRQLMEEGKKYCPTCRQIKDLSEFSTMKVRNGIASHCKECSRQWHKTYRDTPEAKEKQKAKYQKRKDKWIDNKLRRKFGITLEQYKARLDEQNNQCIICGRTPEENGKMLAVDHNHSTNEVRDLLCNNCNVTVGFVEKNQIDLVRLSWYLNKHKIKTNVLPSHS